MIKKTQTPQISQTNNLTIDQSIKQHVDVQVKTNPNNKPYTLKVKNKRQIIRKVTQTDKNYKQRQEVENETIGRYD